LFGGTVAENSQLTLTGRLRYVPLDQEPIKELCEYQIVLIDRRGSFLDRSLKAKELGVKAVIIIYHDISAAAAKLTLDCDERGKRKKVEKKAEEKSRVVFVKEAENLGSL
jgi:hypothetical protein